MANAARRSRPGDGSVYPIGDGKFIAAISMGGRGNRRYRRVTKPSKAEALEALRRLRAECAPLAILDEPAVTLETYLAAWLHETVRPAVRKTTLATYSSILSTHVYPRLGMVRLDRLTAAHLRKLLADLEREAVGPRLREVVHQRLKAALAVAVERGALVKNPMIGVARHRVPRRTMNVWSAEQARMFLDGTADHELAALWRLALSAGLRRGEILALRTVDFDARGRRLRIQHTLSAAGELLEPKTAGARRAIDLPDRAVAALLDHRQRLLAAGLGGSLWLFPVEGKDDPRRGEVRLPRAVARAFERATAAVDGALREQLDAQPGRAEPSKPGDGLPRIRFHDLRHTCATLHLANGTHPKIVSEMLGHASIQITLDTYSHVLPSMQRDAADRFDAVL
ncbi:MAG: Phage integrase [Candidatus Eremiobacteraeota bacterium]|nr:Phage integrase [Candidatus Eremiobacteraeota bacterium]